MTIFLGQEIDRIQVVLELVKNTLEDLLLAIDGIIIMNEVTPPRPTRGYKTSGGELLFDIDENRLFVRSFVRRHCPTRWISCTTAVFPRTG